MKRWHLVAVGFLSGVVVTGAAAYVVSLPIVELFAHSTYISAASNGALDVAVLNKLRSGDPADAIQTMELRLAGNEVTLAEYIHSTEASKRAPAVVSAVSKIDDYRKQYPSPLPPNTSFERTREK
jgi:hypothetical protein